MFEDLCRHTGNNYLMGQGNVQAHPFGPGLDKDKWTAGKEQFWMENYIMRLEELNI